MSSAVQRITVVPRVSDTGLLALHDWLRSPEASLATTEKAVIAVGEVPLVGLTEKLLGQVIDGGALSETETGNEQVFTFPALSCTEHVTVCGVSRLNRVTPESEQTTGWVPDPSVAVTFDKKLRMGSGRLSDS